MGICPQKYVFSLFFSQKSSSEIGREAEFYAFDDKIFLKFKLQIRCSNIKTYRTKYLPNLTISHWVKHYCSTVWNYVKKLSSVKINQIFEILAKNKIKIDVSFISYLKFNAKSCWAKHSQSGKKKFSQRQLIYMNWT